MTNLNFTTKVAEASEKINKLEELSGVGLLQPFNNTNSSSRKIMYYLHRSQSFALIYREKAIVETGYENRYGDYSSSIIKTDSRCQVIAKIPKFSFAPNHHYWLIFRDTNSNRLNMVERISYHHITQEFGYLNNNEVLDNMNIGDIIPEGEIIKKSLGYDKYNNREDGINLNVAYMALDDNMEDSNVVSDVAASRMTAPLIKPVSIMINENDLPLNIYGNDKVYKSFPDVGEKIRDGILLALRKEKKEDALFMQSVNRLKEVMITDEKFTLHGTVIDVNIYCNNPENLDSLYSGQFKMYYDELQRSSSNIVSCLTQLVASGYTMSYELQKLFANAKRVLNKDQYVGNRLFSNLQIEITVLEEKKLDVGDKMSNRFGGKGVVSRVIPQHLMPKTENGEYVDVILNSSTMYNRENPGQLFELSITHIGCEILNLIGTGAYDEDDSLSMIKDYITLCSPEQGAEFSKWVDMLDIYDKRFLLESILEDGAIHVSIRPMSESMDIDKINRLYKKFRKIKQSKIYVPIRKSDGNIRFIEAIRRVVVGKQYMFRLKQFAEEKFSATSLSSTNIKNENVKSKANREFRELYSNTPIRIGNMEADNENHIGTEYVVTNLMIHSTSPHGRRLVEKFYYDDPYNTDIKLDEDAKSRSAEIVNTYLKTIGLRLKFVKRKKTKINPIKISAISFDQSAKTNAIHFVNEEGFDFVKDFKERMERKKKRAIRFNAIRFMDDYAD